jgi:predicted Rossmann-fold nucleotide-binding protein
MSIPTPTPTPTPVDVPLDKAALESPFVQEKADKPLRVCCYGSSSSLTPVKYLSPAKSVGYILAKRGHTCVNGAGSFGCMAAMNDGAADGNGHIVGVIHEMWLVDSSDWGVRDQERRTLRDGGAHSVFDGANGNNDNSNASERDGPKREMLVAGGKDLQERKRLLVDKADALIVLPGGPGTWDEVRSVACGVHVHLLYAIPMLVLIL